MPDEAAAERTVVSGSFGGGAIVTSLVNSVASVRGVQPTALPPLQATIDTDALEALLESARTNGSVLTVDFEYAECHISVNGDGIVRVRRVSERT